MENLLSQKNYEKHLHECVISLREEVWTNRTSLTCYFIPFRNIMREKNHIKICCSFIPLPSQESWMLGVSFIPLPSQESWMLGVSFIPLPSQESWMLGVSFIPLPSQESWMLGVSFIPLPSQES
jgi:hypothetical protein